MTEFKFRQVASTTWFPIIRDGSDLGSNFDHSDGFLYFLFGDTGDFAGDPIGRTNAPLPGPGGLVVDLFPSVFGFPGDPAFVTIDGISQGVFEVPTGGFSTGDKLHVFFTTDHDAAGPDVMGRCVLASARLPTDLFRVDVEVDSMPRLGRGGVGKFINVCPRIITAAEHPELPSFLTNGVMMWGSGAYRASDVYLAFAPLDKVAGPSKSGWIYYAGDPDPLEWLDEPEAAKPLLGESVVGELSVAFIPGLRQWIMLYGGGLNPIAASCRMAPNPWGPWTKLADSGNLILSDGRVNGGFGQSQTGPYGLYIIDRFTRWDPAAVQATLWFPASENDSGSGIYRTHLVKTVLAFDALPPKRLPGVVINVVPDTVTSGEDATATISLAEPFGFDLEFDISVFFPGASDVQTDTAKTFIRAGDTAVQFRVTTEPRTDFRDYSAQIEASYIAPQLPDDPRETADGRINVKPPIEVGILSSISLFPSSRVRAGESIQARVSLEGPVEVPTDVSVGAFDPGVVSPVEGPTDAVTLSRDVVTIPAHGTSGQFEIHANDVTQDRQVTILAIAVVQKRTHLTVERG